MSDTHRSTSERLAWLSYPLLIFAVSRGLILAFTASAGLFGGNVGAPPGLPTRFGHERAFWGIFAHGDLANLARLASNGYRNLADASYFPLVPWLAKGLGPVLGSMEGALIALSLLACAAAFVGVYHLFESLAGPSAARWGVALLAAFPFSYHLSDGSALACGLALSVWGTALVARGSSAVASALLALAALAHPVGIVSALAAACLPMCRPWWRRLLVLLLPCCVLLLWLLHLRSHLGVRAVVLWHAWWAEGTPAGSAWTAILVSLGGLALGGILLLGRGPLRLLMLAGGLMLGCILYGWQPGSAHALVLVWPAFLGLAGLLAQRQPLGAPLVAMLGAQQGLLLYCYTHFLRLT